MIEDRHRLYLALVENRLTTEAERFIDDNKDRPFFLYLSHYSVHTPLNGKSWLVAYRFWTGLDNYLEVVTNFRFWQSIGRTLLIMGVCVPIEPVEPRMPAPRLLNAMFM